MAFKLNPNAFKPQPIPEPRILTHEDPITESVVENEVRLADAAIAATDSAMDGLVEPVVKDATESNISDETKKLSSLVDDDFPFDDTQLVAIDGIAEQQYACLTGAAGTGKTTTTKKIVDVLQNQGMLGEVDMSTYWRKGESKADADDDYEMPEDLIPSIALVSFTGRATQMIKKNFPRDWHGNIMTIHRCLGFYPEFYEDYDEESDSIKNKMRFVPAYNKEFQLPWDIIIIDEAGMLGLDLWHQLWAACKPTTRIIMIGDINQLPPTHGKSIFGFALSNWPSWELTHVHRQQGANNSIVDNAHRILKGLRPISDCKDPTANFKSKDGMLKALNWMVKDPDWRFAMFEVDEDSRKASMMIRMGMKMLQGRIYEPNRDALITPINGYESTQTGYMLGQDQLNQELAITLNAGQERWLIDGGRDRKKFAVGDKVMATRNDYEAGITNGMTGIVESIVAHGGYQGDSRRWGKISEVQAYIQSIEEDFDDEDFSLEELATAHDEQEEGAEQAKEGRDRGPSSHIVTVRFGEGDHSFTIPFGSLAEVASLQLAYAVTCHKMQGGEAPLVGVIIHQAHKRPLNREWGYTGVTRASHRCVIFYTKQGLGFMLTKQNIKGATLEAKVQAFQALQKVGIAGAAVKVSIPKALSTRGELVVANERFQAPSPAERMSRIMEAVESTVKPKAERLQPDPLSSLIGKTFTVRVQHEHVVRVEGAEPVQESKIVDMKPAPIDGGELTPQGYPEGSCQKCGKTPIRTGHTECFKCRGGLMEYHEKIAQQRALPAPPKLIPQTGAVMMMHKIEDAQATPLLTYQPKPVPKMTSLAALIAKQKGLN